MAGRSQPPAGALPAAGGSRAYPFGNGLQADGEAQEEDGEVSELRPRGREKVRRSTSRDRLDDIVLLTKDIQEGETLNAIALQYCCSVSLVYRAVPNAVCHFAHEPLRPSGTCRVFPIETTQQEC